MDQASISRIEEWDSRPVSGGYVGLNELAGEGFTGAVATGGTRLIMLNGRVVGVFDGSIDDFESGDATAYEAPDPSLPLLFAMWERDGEVRGQYYTDDTPIREVDETLSEGGFTGYLELADNVLSGDYYLVYYGGRSLAVAFVGNRERVVTGEEAFDLAADEVGIYEVRAVELSVTDVPEAPATSPGGASSAGDDGVEEPADVEDAGAAGAATEEATEPPVADQGGTTDAEEPTESADPGPAESDPAGGAGVVDETPPAPGAGEEEPPGPERDEATDDTATAPVEGTVEEGSSTDGDDGTEAPGGTGDGGRTAPPLESAPAEEPDERFEEEARWREAKTVPALDPDESEPAAPAETTPAGADSPRPTRQESAAPEGDVDALTERLHRLERELESSERERRRLTERLEESVDESVDVAADREALEERIEELEARLRSAESSAASARSATAGGSGGTGQAVDVQTALDQTDLFVRYGSKSEATLETAHKGRADAEEVAENLRIESHSRFDAATATVAGRPFDDFLADSIHYRFVRWLVEELLYEIQETGSKADLKALYDVLPLVDRAEFNGTVTGVDEEGEDRQLSFDVVCRDRMGKPLVVANINDSLDPATGEMMVRLVEDGTQAAEPHESIGAAFFVTASFFEPDALETVAEATRGGGLLSRDSKKSYVKLSRSGGYHLCLVEARGDDFHVAVPDF